ncbi:MAG: hypothetical protein ACKO0V_23470 [bacterium]
MPRQNISWSPAIASPRRVRALSSAPWFEAATLVDESGGKSGSSGFWLISTSLEDAYYRPAVPGHSMDALLPTDPAFQVTSRKLASGKYSLQLKMNKTGKYDKRGNEIESRFLFGAVNESFDLRFQSSDKPKVSDNIMVEFQYRINQMKFISTPAVPNPRARLTVGMGMRHQGLNNLVETLDTKYLEVNIARSGSYDYCISGRQPYFGIRLPVNVPRLNSDPLKIYDQRHCWGLAAFRPDDPAASELASSGELVYFNARTTREVTLNSRPDGWQFARIPLSKLVLNYNWQRPPADWQNAEVAGVYFGVEAWGRVVAEWELKNLIIFKDEPN